MPGRLSTPNPAQKTNTRPCHIENIERKMAGELILIIEDNDKNRKLVRDVLQAKGYKTIESETAEEGIKLAYREIS